MSKWPRRSLPLGAQALALRSRWSAGKTTFKRNTVRWVGPLQPTTVSPVYTVEVEYNLQLAPVVRVLDPPLDPGHRERLPHVYSGDRLCLYNPLSGDWNRGMLLADTILPWAAEWLFHYEVWKVTDQWVGGGDVYAPPDSDLRRVE